MKKSIRDSVISWSRTKLRVRLLRKGDETILLNFFNNLSERTKKNFRPHSFDLDTIKKIVNEVDKDIDIMRFLILNEKSCEMLAYTLLWNLRDEYVFFGICIRDDYQCKGLGKVLMAHFIEVVRCLDKKALVLMVLGNNKAARRLYSKFGFKVMRVDTMELDLK